ncbi:hypothetical protein AHAS_Ahas16G0182600 [Arachis hypogaea]
MLLLLQEEDTTIGISPRLRVLSRDLSSSLRVAAVVAVAVSVVQGGMKWRSSLMLLLLQLMDGFIIVSLENV